MRLGVARVFATFGLVFATVVAAAVGWSTWSDAHGRDTTGDVVQVERSSGRPKFTVRFVAEGQACESLVVPPDGVGSLRPGDRVAIHYPRYGPCLNVRGAGERFWWGGLIPSVALMALFGVFTQLAWRRPEVLQRWGVVGPATGASGRP